MHNIAIIGCGNLGRSIAEGLAEGGDGDYRITATRRNTAAISDLVAKGIDVTKDNKEAVMAAEMVILTVKPYNVEQVLEEISDVLDPARHIVISAASGVTIAEMRYKVSKDLTLFRAMPNTATLVRSSITCICHDSATAAQSDMVHSLFNHVGRSVEVREDLMEAATVLGACGIAYAMRFIRAMTQGGIQIGFSAELASLIASQTVKGAAELLLEGQSHPESEIDKVTTPKGCTIVGLNEMEHSGFSSSLIKGIVSSFNEIG
jgi:pyrroline-5-carboxylate reductase